MTTVIYPGTFDPVTKGHVDIIQRAAKLFDRLIIAVAASTRKSPFFSLEKRINFIKLALEGIPTNNIIIESYNGLLVDFAKEKGAKTLIRSIRASADLEYELQLASMNRQLAPEVETLFLVPTEQYSLISSTIVREIIAMGGDIRAFVPDAVARVLAKS